VWVESVGTVLQRANDFCAQPMVVWAYDQMPRRLGAGGALIVLRLRSVLGYNVRLERVPGICVQRVQIVEPETTKKEGRLQRRLSSSFFDRFRCRQSLDRGFGTLRSHWSSHFVDLSTVRLIFKHFEQFNIKDPFGGWTRRCSPEWGELLYQVVVFMSYVQ
jgi:hypothetical protein